MVTGHWFPTTVHQEKNHVASETNSGLSRLSRLERNLWDIVVTVHCVRLTDTGHSHGCSSAFQTQFSLTDANSFYRCRSHSYWCEGSSYSYKIAIKGTTRLSNLKDLNYIYIHARHSKKDIEKGLYKAS